jgi:hypothetical protein
LSAKYIADYFTGTVTPDYNASMSLAAQGTISEESSKSQIIHYGVDGSEERISFGTASIFYVTYRFNQLSESDSGTVFDFYNDSAKANGTQRSFEWSHTGDSHIYCVRFDCKLTRTGNSVSRYGYPDIRLKILGVAHA